MAALQITHWFNPLVWLAFSRIRAARELACDELALTCAGAAETKPYGRTIVKLLESFGDSLRAPSLAGIVENNQQMKERIAMIANFQRTNRGTGLAATLFLSLGLLTLTEAQPAAAAPPKIVSSSPKNGEANVDPASVKEITVTFDQDMGGGMSWTGGGPAFPNGPEGQRAHWIDKRTCVLPVALEAAHKYRVGINSLSYQNFRNVSGMPAVVTALQFSTSGAPAEDSKPAARPVIVSTSPAVGAKGVDPGITEITVTFDQDMGDGMSWTGGGSEFPATPQGGQAHWRDKRNCVLPVKLQAGHFYRVGINSQSYNNFMSAQGTPAAPSAIYFTTKGANARTSARTRVPRVVRFEPEN